MRTRLGVAMAAALIVLTGCTANPSGASPTPSAPSSEVSTPPPSPSPTPEATTVAVFTDAALIDLCVEKTTSDHGGSPEFQTERATVEAIEADPPWLVIVPVKSTVGDAISYCTIGGTQDAPVFELYGAAAPSMEPEIRTWADAGPTE